MVTTENRLPEIARSLRPRFNDVERKTSRGIARQAAATAPRDTGALAASYRATDDGVVALSYYHWPEFGQGRGPAQPHLLPAAEAGRVALSRHGVAVLESL